MLVGHLAAGLLGKRIQPQVSLGTCVTAALLADFIFFPLLLAGIENVVAVPNVSRNRIIGQDIGYSHSLTMLAIWSGLFAAAHFWRKHNLPAAIVLFAVAFSHWVLDLISHRPDMPLIPGGNTVLGFGLWNSIPATLIVEGGLWLLAIIVYARSSRAKSRLGVLAFWIGVIMLSLIWYANINASMDPDRVSGGVGGLISFSLVTAWAYWVDHLRTSKA